MEKGECRVYALILLKLSDVVVMEISSMGKVLLYLCTDILVPSFPFQGKPGRIWCNHDVTGSCGMLQHL